MENIKISQVCGLCAGCTRAIDTAVKEVESGVRYMTLENLIDPYLKRPKKYLKHLKTKKEA